MQLGLFGKTNFKATSRVFNKVEWKNKTFPNVQFKEKIHEHKNWDGNGHFTAI